MNIAYGILMESYTKKPGSFKVAINGKNYTVYINGDDLNVFVNDGTDKRGNTIMSISPKVEKDVLAKCTKIIAAESDIKDQVYACFNFKSASKEDIEKQKAKDHITSFELVGKGNSYRIGIFFSHVNQFYTVYENGKIDKKNTYVY